MFRGVRPSAQGAWDDGSRRQRSMHPSGRHKSVQVEAEEGPPLGLGGGARACRKALSEGSGVPAFVLYSVTQIGTPHGGFRASAVPYKGCSGWAVVGRPGVPGGKRLEAFWRSS